MSTLITCDLLKEVDFQHAIKALYADRACDRHKFYKLCNEYDIKTKIPPINNAAEHSKIDYMSDRNAAIRLIKLYGEDGMKEWKKKRLIVFFVSVMLLLLILL
ncbi:hypothetical protein [Wolbachia endosymbiont (group B) of Longitarsus flavicornis]|uniref:hypothetical protein n=1 Tax=Wolbachia endosymbiont (group B) of Longitarsus flavicornis TaxID=3066135 RepID=UPI00333FF453